MSERKHLPTLREFLDPVVEDMDPDNCIEDEFRVGFRGFTIWLYITLQLKICCMATCSDFWWW